MNDILKSFLLGSSIVFFYNCASLSSFQDAKTLEKGKVQAYVAATKYTETFDDGVNLITSDTLKSVDFIVVDLGARVGVTDNIDVGLKYTIPGGVVGDVKYMFTDPTTKFAASTGGKIGYLNITSESDNSDTADEYTVLDFGIPLYASYYPLSWLSLTANPMALFRSRFGTNTNLKSGMVIGGTGNIKIGKSAGIMFETGYFKDLGTQNSYTLMSGMFFAPLSLGNLLGGLLP